MGKLHWRLNNHFQHHGGAGFHALGFDPSRDLRQGFLTFMFDDDAMKRSEAAVLEQLPRLLHAASRDSEGLEVEARARFATVACRASKPRRCGRSDLGAEHVDTIKDAEK